MCGEYLPKNYDDFMSLSYYSENCGSCLNFNGECVIIDRILEKEKNDSATSDDLPKLRV